MRNRIQLLAASVLTVAVPVATWGLLGRQDEPGVPSSELTYVVEPFPLSTGLETALGVVALLLAGASAALLVHASWRGTFDRRWWQVLGLLVAAGLVAGGGWRGLTSGTVDANIGAGLVILFGGPVVVGLILVAAARGTWLARHGRTGRGVGGTPEGRQLAADPERSDTT